MRRTILASVVAVAALSGLGAGLASGLLPATAAVPQSASPKTYDVDAVHSAILYKVKHLNASWSYGRFNKFSGKFLLDPKEPANSVIDVTVDVDSIDSGNEKRDNHLRSQDFFSAKEFSTITFKSTSVKKKDDKTFEVTGDLTLHGQKKPLTVTVDLVGAGPGARGGEVAGIHSVFTIKRSDFGMNFMVGPLGDEVTMTVSLEGGR
jgi:polyisoprenoid-binding protein YceI